VRWWTYAGALDACIHEWLSSTSRSLGIFNFQTSCVAMCLWARGRRGFVRHRRLYGRRESDQLRPNQYLATGDLGYFEVPLVGRRMDFSFAEASGKLWANPQEALEVFTQTLLGAPSLGDRLGRRPAPGVGQEPAAAERRLTGEKRRGPIQRKLSCASPHDHPLPYGIDRVVCRSRACPRCRNTLLDAL
jgi:hypothetical protein